MCYLVRFKSTSVCDIPPYTFARASHRTVRKPLFSLASWNIFVRVLVCSRPLELLTVHLSELRWQYIFSLPCRLLLFSIRSKIVKLIFLFKFSSEFFTYEGQLYLNHSLAICFLPVLSQVRTFHIHFMWNVVWTRRCCFSCFLQDQSYFLQFRLWHIKSYHNCKLNVSICVPLSGFQFKLS